MRDHLARAQREGSRGFVTLFTGAPEDEVPEEALDTLGTFYTTLMMGLMAQWTFDPKSAPDAGRLTEGLRQVIERAAAATGDAP